MPCGRAARALISWLGRLAAALLFPVCTSAQVASLEHAHAHNDYRHARPLLDALDRGFASIEADVHLVGGRLLVAHHRDSVDAARTLEALYLQPLREYVQQHGGRASSSTQPLILLIDVKSDSEATYVVLDSVLRRYADILTMFAHGEIVPGPVVAVISGNRAIGAMRAARVRFAALDGRIADLAATPRTSRALMPLVSDSWDRSTKWKGDGPVPAGVRRDVRRVVDLAHQQGQKIRFWGTADNAAVWQVLRDARVDLIGADNLDALRAFLTHQPPPTPAPTGIQFVEHTIGNGLAGGYQVVVADLNRDGTRDVIAVASDRNELLWYENPGWQPHVIVSGISAPINAAAYDVDGDGIPEIALAHGFSNQYASSPGIVSILTHNGDPALPWLAKEIDRLPTSHRLRFADVEGTGKAVLVNFPLIGAQATAPLYRDHVPLVMYRPGEWKRELISDADEGVVHGIFSVAWNGDTRHSLLSASFQGVHALRLDSGQWTRTKLVDGDPAAWPRSGSSEIVVGRSGRERFLATIEPWHGNQVVVYRQIGIAWTRHVIDDSITDGHTIVVGDFDGDGQDEIVVGERGGKRSVYLYRAMAGANDQWSRQVLDDGGMAAAGCAVADVNGDRRADVVCIGTATANLKWYENRP